MGTPPPDKAVVKHPAVRMLAAQAAKEEAARKVASEKPEDADKLFACAPEMQNSKVSTCTK